MPLLRLSLGIWFFFRFGRQKRRRFIEILFGIAGRCFNVSTNIFVAIDSMFRIRTRKTIGNRLRKASFIQIFTHTQKETKGTEMTSICVTHENVQDNSDRVFFSLNVAFKPPFIDVLVLLPIFVCCFLWIVCKQNLLQSYQLGSHYNFLWSCKI